MGYLTGPHSQNFHLKLLSKSLLGRGGGRKAEGGRGVYFQFAQTEVLVDGPLARRDLQSAHGAAAAQRRHITAGTQTHPSDPTFRDSAGVPCTGTCTAPSENPRRDVPSSIFGSSREEMTGARSSQASVCANRLARIGA